jgi:chromosome segregation ATPase
MADTLEQKLAWLEDQRRKDADLLRSLTARLDGLEGSSATHGRQVQEITSEISRLTALATRISKVDEALSKHRQEVAHQISLAEERRTDREKQIEQARRSEREDTARALETFRQELLKLTAVEEWLIGRRDEEMRLSRIHDSLAKQVEGLVGQDEHRRRALESLHAAQAADARKIADLQAEASDLRVRNEGMHGSMDVLEDGIRRLEIRLTDLTASERERQELQTLWIEQQGLRMVEIDKGWKDQERKFTAMQRWAAELEERAASYEETQRGLVQLRLDVQAALEMNQRRGAELAELQRLGDERIKAEWARFQGDDQKRWNTYRLTTEEQWRDHLRRHEKAAGEIEGAATALARLQSEVELLQEGEMQALGELLTALQHWATAIDKSRRG